MSNEEARSASRGSPIPIRLNEHPFSRSQVMRFS